MGTQPWHETSHVFSTEAKGFDEKLWETEMARQALHLEQTKVRLRVSWMMSTAPLNPRSLLAKLNKFQLKSCRCTSRKCCQNTQNNGCGQLSRKSLEIIYHVRWFSTWDGPVPQALGLFARIRVVRPVPKERTWPRDRGTTDLHDDPRRFVWKTWYG